MVGAKGQNVDSTLATPAIMEDLRAGMDGMGGSPPPFRKEDHSRLMQVLGRVQVGIGPG